MTADARDGSPFNEHDDGSPFNEHDDGSPFNEHDGGSPFNEHNVYIISINNNINTFISIIIPSGFPRSDGDWRARGPYMVKNPRCIKKTRQNWDHITVTMTTHDIEPRTPWQYLAVWYDVDLEVGPLVVEGSLVGPVMWSVCPVLGATYKDGADV